MRNHFVRSSLATSTAEILDVDEVFGAVAYSGNGSTSGKALTFGAGVDMLGKGGMGWVKCREDGSTSHIIQDSERGLGESNSSYGYTKILLADQNRSEGYNQYPQGFIKELTSTGYKVARGSSSTSNDGANKVSHDYVAYAFRKAAGFFDIKTWTGNGVSGREIAHDLDSVPGAIWIKKTSGSADWWCYHRQTASSSPEDYYLVLNETDSKVNQSSFMNDTAPTSTHFTLGNSDNVNGNSQTYVAYIFGHNDARFGSSQDKSIIQCGGYYGNGSTNGTTVNIGWRPQFLIFKNPSNSSMHWRMYDTERGINAGNDPRLMPNTDEAEQNTFDKLDLTSTGFQTQHTGSDMNQNNTLITYIAIREAW